MPGIDVQPTNNGSKTVDVVVRGFKEKKSAESIISEIEDMLRIVRGGSQGVIIDVPSDPSNCGFLKFDSFDEKLKFYKTAHQKKKDGALTGDMFFHR